MARVLLIDDDRDQLEIRALIFTHHGHVVDAASNAVDAIRIFQEAQPDCVVMDLRIPILADGLRLIRAFRGTPAFAGRILVLSGFPADLDGTPEASMIDEILAKPVRSDILLRLVKA